MGLGIRLSKRNFLESEDTDYDEWRDPGTGHTRYISASDGDRGDDEISATLNYKHQFVKKGHELLAEADYESESPDDQSTEELRDMQKIIQSGRRTIEKGPEYDLRTKLEYTLPLREKNVLRRVGRAVSAVPAKKMNFSNMCLLFKNINCNGTIAKRPAITITSTLYTPCMPPRSANLAFKEGCAANTLSGQWNYWAKMKNTPLTVGTTFPPPTCHTKWSETSRSWPAIHAALNGRATFSWNPS